MDCLKDYIGIRHCSQEYPPSGLYLNNLPGISTELVDKIANSEQVTFLGVWEDVQTRAIGRFVQDFQMYLFDTARTGFNKTIYQTSRMVKPRSYDILDPEALLKGVYVYLPISRFVKFNLKSVQVFVKEIEGGAFDSGFNNGFDGDTSLLNSQIFIYDLQNETLLKTIDITFKYGINTFDVDLEIGISTNAIELFVCIDTTRITSIKTLDNLYIWNDGECQYNTSHYGSWFDDQAMIAPAVMDIGDMPTHANIKYPGVGQGVAIDAQITCSIEQFICENKKYLKTAFLYLLGAEMLLQKLTSNMGSRVNWFTYGNLEQTQNTKNIFESEYAKAMKNAVLSLNISDSGLCFECNENAQSFETHAMP